MNYEILSVIANISFALSFIIALIFGIVQVRHTGRDRKDRLTLEALHNFRSREFAELDGLLNYHKSPSSLKEFEQLPLDEQTKFIQFYQEMEAVGILVADGLIELGIVDKTVGPLVTSAWKKYKIIFEEIRARNSDPFLGEYFQWLAESINDRNLKNPRKPFYETNQVSQQ